MLVKDFSDYIVYVDESGDHGLGNVNRYYPLFVLAFCVFKKDEYIAQTVPELQRLKFKYWGHDAVVLHEHDIRNVMRGDYTILKHKEIRTNLIQDLNNIVESCSVGIISSIIDKDKLLKSQEQRHNPYELAMLLCMEVLCDWLCEQGEAGKSVHIIFESRGRKEDEELELEFRRICDNASTSVPSDTDFSRIDFTIRFVDKRANAAGLQIADLVARPIGLSVLRPEQKNRAFETIKKKFVRSPKLYPR